MYLNEARSRHERIRARSASLDTRAGLLISVGALVVTLQVGQDNDTDLTCMFLLSALSTVAAIIMALIVLWSRKGNDLDNQRLRDRIVNEKRDPYLDVFWLADKYFQHLEDGEKAANSKAKFLNSGFLLLGVAVTFSLISIYY